MLVTKLTVLFYFQLAGLILFILCHGIISTLTFLTGKENNITHNNPSLRILDWLAGSSGANSARKEARSPLNSVSPRPESNW